LQLSNAAKALAVISKLIS